MLLPNLLLAWGFLLLGHAIGGGNIFEFLDRLLSTAWWLLTWGILAATALLVAMMVGGFLPRWRWLAAFCVAFLSLSSAGVLITLGAGPYTFGQWLFLSPGLLSLGIGGWLSFAEWPRTAIERDQAGTQ
ncbi:MAG: hypothetical protein LH481_13315 [Burkholderiales bacterium]|nr:hypothetical protein [Burkholderiales bacterium]